LRFSYFSECPKLFADDGLARPIPETPTVSDLAKGLDRTLVLGGGGEYYVAWYCGFFHGLYELGVDLNVAEMVVGTSAGAYAGSSLTSGHFQRLDWNSISSAISRRCLHALHRSPAPTSARSGRRRSTSASKTEAQPQSAPSAMPRSPPTTGRTDRRSSGWRAY
jgi:Patatin-like phospholipase